MMRTAACILALQPQSFRWIGPQPAIRWAMKAAAGIRGVDKRILVSTQELFERVRSEAADNFLPVVAPALLSDDTQIIEWLCGPVGPLHDFDCACILRSNMPFIKAERAEECLELVWTDRASSVMTVQKVHVVGDNTVHGCHVFCEGHSLCRGVLALAPGKFRGDSRSWPRNFALVEVNSIEAIDIDNPDGLKIAKALVDRGEA